MPLLRMDAGSVGSSEGIEENLDSIFRTAERWKAVLLLDEADVFFEKRVTFDLEKHRLVTGKAVPSSRHHGFLTLTRITPSAFLRGLEYFEGVLFLTTNRVSSFDPAFKSRIHLALHYAALDSSDRHSVWRNFLTGPGVHASPELLEDRNIESIADTRLNGRQIKNIVHIANSLAVSQETQVTHEHLRLALDAVNSFDKLIDIEGGDKGDDFEEAVDDGMDIPGRRKRKRTEADAPEDSSSG